MENFGTVLREARRAAALSQKETAAWLSKQLEPITGKAVSKWENGDRLPNAIQLLLLCRLYGIQNPLEAFLGESTLNSEGLKRLLEYRQLLENNPRFTPSRPATVRPLRVFEQPAAAGPSGQYVDSEDCRIIEIDKTIAPSADFGVLVAGDSMEPFLSSGSIMLVEQAEVLPEQVGLFVYEGRSLIKQLRQGPGGLSLCSFNPAYEPVFIPNPEDLYIQGRYVGQIAGS